MNRYLLAGLVAAVAFGSFVAMAASLGGITAEDLGADDSAVASCDTDGVTTSYTIVYDAVDARDEITETIVGGVAAGCAGQTITVTLTNSADAVLDTASAVAAAGSNTITSATPPSAELVANVHVVITG